MRTIQVACCLGLATVAAGQSTLVQHPVTLCDGSQTDNAPTNPACSQADMRLQVVGAPLPNENFGLSMATGYLNDDDFADLIVGAPEANRVYIYLGALVDGRVTDPANPLVNADTADYILQGPANSDFGFSVALGEFTAPPPPGSSIVRPLIIGAPGTNGDIGRAYLLRGTSLPAACQTGCDVGTVPGLIRFNGETAGDRAGYSVAGGSFGAASEDYVIGAHDAQSERGRVYVIVGGSGLPATVDLSSLPPASFRITGSADNEGLGEYLVLGELDSNPANGTDLAIGAVGTLSGTSNPRGRVYVVPGSTSSNVTLDDAVNDGVRCVEGETANDFFGFSMATGNFDGAGGADLAVGAINADNGNETNAGAVYVLLGNDLLNLPLTGCSRIGTGLTPLTIRGEKLWDQFGFSLAVGNIEGTGGDDLAVSARWHDRRALPTDVDELDEGAVYVFFASDWASPGWPATIACGNTPPCDPLPNGLGAVLFGGNYGGGSSDEVGFSLAVGDFNEDRRFDDIAVSSVTHERVYVASLSSADATVTAPGQAQDPGTDARDIRDRDDDGDGYLDVNEDCNEDGNLDANESDPLVPNRDVGVAISAPASVPCDDAFTVTIDVTNRSPQLFITGTEPQLQVALQNQIYQYVAGSARITRPGGAMTTLPGGFPFAAPFALGDPADPLQPGETIQVTFDLKPIANPGSAPASESVVATVLGVTNEIADAHCSLAAFGNSRVTAVSLDCPDLTVAKSDGLGGAKVDAGGTLTYTIDVSNGGRAEADNVQVSDTLPAGTTYSGTDTCPGTTTFSSGTNTLTCDLGTITQGGAGSFDVTVDVDPGLANNTVLGNTASALARGQCSLTTAQLCRADTDCPGGETCNGDYLELNGLNNSGSVNTTVQAVADMQVVKTAPPTANAGQPILYTIQVTNAGPSDATGVVVTDDLPAGVDYPGSTTCGAAVFDAPNHRLICTIGALAAGASTSFTITGNVNPATVGAIANTASVTSSTVENAGTLGDNSSTAMTTVLTVADLSVTKTDSVDPVIAGNALTWTVTVSNAGPGNATAVSVSDTLPAGVTLVSTTGCAADPNGVPTCDLGTIAAGGSKQYTIAVTVDPDTTGTLSNTATVTSAAADPTPGNDSATQTTMVDTQADLSITKTDSVDPATAGQPLTYTITVSNAGPSDAAGVMVSDTLPAGVTFDSTTGCAEDPSGVPTCTLGPIPAGGSAQYTLAVTVDTGTSGTLMNTATVSATTTDPVPGNNSATENTSVAASADLSVTKTDSVDPVLAGNALAYTITVSNAGPSDATNVVATETLPAGVTFVSTVGCAGDPNGVPTCNLGTIASGGSKQYTVNVTVNPGALGTITNNVSVASSVPDLVPGNNATSEDTTVNAEADLAATIADNVDPVSAGQTLVYTVSVTNNGPSDAAGVSVATTLDAGVTLVSTSGCAADPNGVPTCGLGTIAAGATKQFGVTVTVGAAVPNGTMLSTGVTVASSTTDPVAGNDSDTETTMVAAAANLSITKIDNVDPVVAGSSTIVYSISVNNAGPSDADSVVVTDMLPAGLTLVSTSGCAEDPAGAPTCSLGTIMAGNSALYSVTASVDASASGTLVNTASVTSAAADPVPGNNTATQNTTVNRVSDLSLTKMVSNATPAVGDPVSFTLMVSNAGPSDASGVMVLDALPSGYAYAGDNGGGAYDSMSGMWTVGTVAASGNASLTLMATVLGSGTYANTAEIVASGSTDPDSTPGNGIGMGEDDEASASTTPTPVIDLSLAKSVDDPAPTIGNNVTFTLMLTNATGYSDATGVVVTDLLPTGYTYVSDTGGGAYNSGTGVWMVGNVAAGSMASLDITATVLGSGIYLNEAEVTAAGQPDANDTFNDGMGNDYATAGTTPTPAPLPPPLPPRIVGFAGDTISWQNQGPAAMNHLYRGDLATLRDSGVFTQDPALEPSAAHLCGLTGDSVQDAFVPAAGQVVFYLVTADNGFEESDLGPRSDGQLRPNDNPCSVSSSTAPPPAAGGGNGSMLSERSGSTASRP